MQWTPDLTVDSGRIDSQHKELFRRIGALVDSVKAHECKYTIGGTIKFLEEYVHTHFSDEEKMMLESSYPGYDAHKAQHSIFIKNFDEFKESVKDEPSSYTRSVYVNQIVVDWIREHILTVDKAFGAYLRLRA